MDIVVVGALVRDGRVLLAHRRPDKRARPDVWDLPGGVMESGESELETLSRELTEELGVRIATDSVSHLSRLTAGSVDEPALLSAWLVREWLGTPANVAPEEHDDLRWFTLDELPPPPHVLLRTALVSRLTSSLELRTSRLRLTRPRASDSEGVFAILADPRTVEHNPSDLLEDLDEAAELVARWGRHWEEHGFGYWCVRTSSSDRIIGYAGVKRMLIDARPVLNLVYRFVPQVWGRGFATEAAAAVVSRTRDEMPAQTIVARIRPDNRSSQNVALKAGLRRDASMDCQGEDGLDWAFTSSEIH